LGVALLLQNGSNPANDVFDFERGADTADRQGPLRVTQARLLMPMQAQSGMMGVVFIEALVSGFYLALVSGWNVILLGVVAIVAAIAYTGVAVSSGLLWVWRYSTMHGKRIHFQKPNLFTSGRCSYPADDCLAPGRSAVRPAEAAVPL
jgi:hypothetical protein